MITHMLINVAPGEPTPDDYVATLVKNDEITFTSTTYYGVFKIYLHKKSKVLHIATERHATQPFTFNGEDWTLDKARKVFAVTKRVKGVDRMKYTSALNTIDYLERRFMGALSHRPDIKLRADYRSEKPLLSDSQVTVKRDPASNAAVVQVGDYTTTLEKVNAFLTVRAKSYKEKAFVARLLGELNDKANAAAVAP